MARKSAATADEQRGREKRKYLRGSRAVRTVVSPDKLQPWELDVKKEMACHYKASDYKYSEIADILSVTVDVVKKWFQEPAMQERASAIIEDMVDSSIRFGRLGAFEMLDIIASIARSSPDDKVAMTAACEYLDRIGLTKVNKSESATTATVKKENEINLIDKSGLIEALADGAPPEVLHRAAELLDELFSITAEHTDKDVTHA